MSFESLTQNTVTAIAQRHAEKLEFGPARIDFAVVIANAIEEWITANVVDVSGTTAIKVVDGQHIHREPILADLLHRLGKNAAAEYSLVVNLGRDYNGYGDELERYSATLKIVRPIGKNR